MARTVREAKINVALSDMFWDMTHPQFCTLIAQGPPNFGIIKRKEMINALKNDALKFKKNMEIIVPTLELYTLIIIENYLERWNKLPDNER